MARTPIPASGLATVLAAAAVAAPASGETTEPTTETPSPAEADDRERHEARVLVAFDDYEPNDIALLTEDELATRDGTHVDSHPAAVEYAKSLVA